METEVYAIWKEGFAFDGRADGQNVTLDAKFPLGHSYGSNPKELLLLSLASCAGMDVVGLWRKDKQFIDHFEVIASVTSESKRNPKVFTSVHLEFIVEGAVDPVVAQRAVRLSLTSYCGVAAMLSGAMAITWSLSVNDEWAGEGVANFDQEPEIHQSSYDG